MPENTDAQIRYVHDRWQTTIIQKDVDGLIALYAEDAIFETPAILVTLKDRKEGVLRGRSEIRPFFEADFASWETNSAAGIAPVSSFPTDGSSSGNIPARHRTATR